LFFILSLLVVRAQSGYVNYLINFRDSANAAWLFPCTDLPGAILIDGYLNNKLKGYRFAAANEVTKRKPLDPQMIPPPWDVRKHYYPEEQVSFEGNFYKAAVDSDLQPRPGNGDFWQKFELLGEPIRSRYYFPNPADSLSKSEFLSRMVASNMRSYPPWDYAAYYNTADRVQYEGKIYEAFTDIQKGEKPSNQDYWVEVGNIIEFYRPSQMVGLKIMYHYQVQNRDTLWHPQMITVLVQDNIEGLLLEAGPSFYYSDAIHYLQSVKQPILKNQAWGYVGSSLFVLDEEGCLKFLEWLRPKLRQGQIKLRGDQILNATAYRNFLEANLPGDDLPNWIAYQDILSKDWMISHIRSHDFDRKITPVVKVPVQAAIKAMKLSKRKLQTYTQALESRVFSIRKEAAQIDSLSPLHTRIMADPPTPANFFLEKYGAPVDSTNKPLVNQLPEVWKIFNDAFYQKKIKVVNPFVNFYMWQQPWPETTIRNTLGPWSAAKRFSLGQSRYDEMDSINRPVDFRYLFVTYKKFTDSPVVHFEPLEISLEFVLADNLFPVHYTFDWQELKQLWKGKTSPTIQSFIDAIESERLNFSSSQLVYGLMEGN
jgi:chitodextrinase